MRIIGGKIKGRNIPVSKGITLRPTTDFAKEGLFNILSNQIDYHQTKVLDLFSGTGNIAFEFASRGCSDVLCIENDFKCFSSIQKANQILNLDLKLLKSDVFDFLKKSIDTFDIIFADPPYEQNNIEEIHELVLSNNLLKKNGILIIEHGNKTKLESLKGFTQNRKYGNVCFSFFLNFKISQRISELQYKIN